MSRTLIAMQGAAICLVVVLSLCTTYTKCASMAHHHTHQTNKERVEDGGFAPRDHEHMKSGEHHSEFDHEAILGSVKEAEEYDHLPSDEAKRRLAILLVKMDLNRDEYIDRKELTAWILRSFKLLTAEESAERFEDADENEDGKVSWEEYKNDAYGSDEEGDTLSIDEESLLKKDKIMFTVADKNQDGFLDKNEFLPFSHPEEHPDMLPLILNSTLEEKDLNHDGEIDFQEFIGEKGKLHDKHWLIAEKDKFDEEYDKDHDGKLSASEILSWVVPSNAEIAQEETEHLFASADDDHDDLLSFDEILDNHETFVGSEATDYGTHLHNIHHFEDEL
ncbi:EFh [Nesidiocoris tenuis]|uniref:EFh n=2 Tax=Nesidiocoris tenuis TaxID=355587 RepID=A0ABN7A8J9_9HEMI|nr:EFh [Nesidiocoris tenuis]